jgi:hypothetical protein
VSSSGSPALLVHAPKLCDGALASGQLRAMPDAIDGIYGNGGNVVSATYRF